MLTIATAQTPITGDVRENGRAIRVAMRHAAAAGARLLHAAEGSLSGYVGAEIEAWAAVDWTVLAAELEETAALAARLGIWVVLGANHRLPPPRWPQNCLIVLSDAGEVVGRYAKRFCSNTETTRWYSPGSEPLVFAVDGLRFGCALCIEVCFPPVFAEYGRAGVECVLLSSYSADPIHGVMARAHAATTCCWLSLATPVACSATLPSMIVGPDGFPLATCPPGEAGIVLHRIDPDAERWHVPLRRARPWRDAVLRGEVHGHRPQP
jgi:deaminated glutathione amidase